MESDGGGTKMRTFQILAALRRFFAARPMETMGAIVHDAIGRTFIPKLQVKLGEAKTDEDRSKIQDLIALYERYSDPRTTESRIYSETASKIIQRLVGDYNLGSDMVDEIAQTVAGDFYIGENSRMDYMAKKFDEMQGPLALNRLWAGVVTGQAKYRLREMHKHSPGFSKPNWKEGEGLDPLEKLEAPRSFSLESIKKIFSDFEDYMNRTIRDEASKIIFQRWWELQQEGGDVNFDREVVPYVAEKTGLSRSVIFSKFKALRPVMAHFYTSILGYELPPAVKRKYHLSSVDVLTCEFFRRRVAAWVLGFSPSSSAA